MTTCRWTCVVLMMLGAAPGWAAAIQPSAPATSPRITQACQRIGPDDRLRIRGDFGVLDGYAAVVGPLGIEGFRAHTGTPIHPAPNELVTWDRLQRVEVRGHGWRRGALVGGIVLGGFGGFTGYFGTKQGLFEPNISSSVEVDAMAAGAGGMLYGAAVGSLIGTGIGWFFPSWVRVYNHE